MSQNAANIRWGDVSAHIKRELDNARERMESAPIAEVPALQGQVTALKSVISWFEHGALAEQALMSSPNPHNQQD